jgi:hypothetical protein
MWILKYYLKLFWMIGSNFMTSWLKGDFLLKSYFRKNNFWPKSENKISNKPVFRKVFWIQFAKKISNLDISGAKVFLWEWNFKISYFNIGMDKMICFEIFFNLWKSCQSGTLIPYLSLYCKNNQIISLNREN